MLITQFTCCQIDRGKWRDQAVNLFQKHSNIRKKVKKLLMLIIQAYKWRKPWFFLIMNKKYNLLESKTQNFNSTTAHGL